MNSAKRLRIIVSCSSLMGVTWVLGVFAIGELTFTFQLLFTIFNSLQGFFIFIFYCALNKDAVNEWKRFFGFAVPDLTTSTGKTSKGDHIKKQSITKRHAVGTFDEPASKNTGELSIYTPSKSVYIEHNPTNKTNVITEDVSMENVQIDVLPFPNKEDQKSGDGLFHVNIDRPKLLPGKFNAQEQKVEDISESLDGSSENHSLEVKNEENIADSTNDIELANLGSNGDDQSLNGAADNVGFDDASMYFGNGNDINPSDPSSNGLPESEFKISQRGIGLDNLGIDDFKNEGRVKTGVEQGQNAVHGVCGGGKKEVRFPPSDNIGNYNVAEATSDEKNQEFGSIKEDVKKEEKDIGKEITVGEIRQGRSNAEKKVYRGNWTFTLN